MIPLEQSRSSSPPDFGLTQIHPDTVDRVFPIRSMIGIEGQPCSIDSIDSSQRKSSTQPALSSGIEELITTRFKHEITKDGHMIITGVRGEKMQKCEDEPIATPGAVQGFGCLLALKKSGVMLTVRIASENSKMILGYSPTELFGLRDFCDILSEEQAEILKDHIEFMKDQDHASSGPDVFPLSIVGPELPEIKLWCAVHLLDGNSNLIICEFELEDDHIFPLSAPTEKFDAPADTLDSDPTEEELEESTKCLSRPLRVLRHVRTRKGEAAVMDVFNLMSQIQGQLASASDLDTFLKILVGLVKELTGFHRIMIYRFDAGWNGTVITELVDPNATKDLYKGLNFPASDIPAQARDLYKINKVRLLYDRELPTSRLVCRSRDDLLVPLDMTHAYLRAMSPIHLEYLKNMAVRASMSVSIMAFGELWGLISCHSYGRRGMRVSFPIRKLCRLIGESASTNVERLSYTRTIKVRKLIKAVNAEQKSSGYIAASSDDLLQLFDADFGMISIKEETKVLGKLVVPQEALALLEYLRMKRLTHITASREISIDFPDLKYSPGFSMIAGLLLVPLSNEGTDFIVFFRVGQLSYVNWAGNPYEKVIKAGTAGVLEPRKSFKIWSETVVGKSREWTDEQVDIASVLYLVYGKFIEVWRRKEAALQNSQLTKILLANVSHEVRTPLNAIINYLEIALEGSLDSETRENLSHSHSASKSLIYVINDLLDLTRTEAGHALVSNEEFDVSELLEEMFGTFKLEAERKGLYFETTKSPDFPTSVLGDQARTAKCISNVIANALNHTHAGGIKVDLLANRLADLCNVEVVVHDTGEGMSANQIDTLFRELEQVQVDDDITGSLASKQASPLARAPGQPGQKMLGLGLAVVARVIRNIGGQLRLSSEIGKGSRVTLHLPFILPHLSEITVELPSSQTTDTLSPVSSEITLVSANMPSTPKKTLGKESFSSLAKFLSTGSEVGDLAEAGQARTQSSSLNKSTLLRTPSEPRSSPLPTVLSKQGSHSPAQSSDDLQCCQKPGLVPELSDGVPMPGSQDLASTASTSLYKRKAPEMDPAEYNFTVLVAEDDPISSLIMKKRMEKMGYKVVLTTNGKQCCDAFLKQGHNFDVILMDLQMPIMDGPASTARIRFIETESPTVIPIKHRQNGRITIFATSATLIEEQRQEYMDTGFDGWILKPIDFKRLDTLMKGILNVQARNQAAYKPGYWEKGGWFIGESMVLKDELAQKESVSI